MKKANFNRVLSGGWINTKTFLKNLRYPLHVWNFFSLKQAKLRKSGRAKFPLPPPSNLVPSAKDQAYEFGVLFFSDFYFTPLYIFVCAVSFGGMRETLFFFFLIKWFRTVLSPLPLTAQDVLGSVSINMGGHKYSVFICASVIGTLSRTILSCSGLCWSWGWQALLSPLTKC